MDENMDYKKKYLKYEQKYNKLTPLSMIASSTSMPIIGIGLEEHISYRYLLDRLPKGSGKEHILQNTHFAKLTDFGQTRIDAMNRTCTQIQVLSWGSAGADKLEGSNAVLFAQDVNNAIYNSIQSNPDRYRGFAHLPTLQPKEAIKELNRAVFDLGFMGAMIVGMQGDKFLDDDLFSPLLSEFERLDVPLYLHPGLPPDTVKNAYYYSTNNLTKDAADNLSIAGWGWHSEVGLHVLRMAFAGVFDRHPKLKLIIGHNGEMLPMMMHRADSQAASLGMPRPISDMLRKNVWVCISGILSMPAIKCAIDTFGIEHMCWAVDYPYIDEAIDNGKEFIRELRDNIGGNGFEALMCGNAKKILKI